MSCMRVASTTTSVALALAAIGVAPAQAFEPTRFSVVVEGEGPDVILIPGLASGRDVWAEEAGRLRDHYRLHLVQLAGFAGEPIGVEVEGEVIAPAVAELHRYIEENGLGDPAVVGHSLGGLMTLMLARDHANDVGRIVVVDALPFYSVLMNPAATAETIAPIAASVRDGLIAMTPEAFEAQQTAGVASLVRTAERRDEVLAWSLASDRSVLARAMYEDLTTDMRADVASIEGPLLAIYAYAPEMGPQAVVDGLYETAYAAAANGGVRRIDGGFHFIMLDQPEAFHEALSGFLADSEAP